MLFIAFLLYLCNVAMGVVAQLWSVTFGRAHHVLYGVVFTAAIVAMAVEARPGLGLTIAALALFPRARPRTVWHPLLAGVGLLGYVLSFVVPRGPI